MDELPCVVNSAGVCWNFFSLVPVTQVCVDNDNNVYETCSCNLSLLKIIGNQPKNHKIRTVKITRLLLAVVCYFALLVFSIL